MFQERFKDPGIDGSEGEREGHLDRLENPETDGSRIMNRERHGYQFEGTDIHKPDVIPKRNSSFCGNPEIDTSRVEDQKRNSDRVKEFEMNSHDVDAGVSDTHEESWRARNVGDTLKIGRDTGQGICWTEDKIRIGRRARGSGRGEVYGGAQRADDVFGLEKTGTLECTRVCELAEREPSEIIQVLLIGLDSGGLQIYLNRCSHEKEYLRAILKVLAKACKCHSMDASLLLILNAVRQESFTDGIVDYITFLTEEVSEGNVENRVQEVKDVIFI